MDTVSNLYRPKAGSDAIICQLCQHYCTLKEGTTGICGVNTNDDGKLKTLVYGHPAAVHIDPIEKKPLYHVLPGSHALSLGTVGCNFRCPFCQNWQISQTSEIDATSYVSPEEIVALAQANRCETIAFTYNEPTIFWPYARDIATLAKSVGIKSVFVTNGLESDEVIDDMRDLIIAANVDLKSYDPAYYKKVLKGDLEGVKHTITSMKSKGIWVEVTTLIIEGVNDSDEALTNMATFLAQEVGTDTPWHLSAFHPDYQMQETHPTSIRTLERARDIAHAQGLHYVYLGNVLGPHNTYCPSCQSLLIERSGYAVTRVDLDEEGACSICQTAIAGIFH